MPAPDLRRAADRITRLAAEPNDLGTLWQETTDVLTRTVPFYWTPCWYTLDPASPLITSHFHYGMAEFPAEWLTAEYYADDVNKLVDVVRSDSGLSTLHEATNGDPSASPRWHENLRMGGDQELILGLRTRTGEVWGALGLYREPGAPMFGTSEKAFLRAGPAGIARRRVHRSGGPRRARPGDPRRALRGRVDDAGRRAMAHGPARR